jgi:hypothetical protein
VLETGDGGVWDQAPCVCSVAGPATRPSLLASQLGWSKGKRLKAAARLAGERRVGQSVSRRWLRSSVGVGIGQRR